MHRAPTLAVRDSVITGKGGGPANEAGTVTFVDSDLVCP